MRALVASTYEKQSDSNIFIHGVPSTGIWR